MKPEPKAKWLEALRSGEFLQTQEGELRTKDGGQFCCLGVLCEVYRRETNGPDWDIVTRHHGQGYLGEGAYLPNEVRDWAGLNAQNPSVQLDGSVFNTTTLADMNDAGKLFREIADIIEEHL